MSNDFDRKKAEQQYEKSKNEAREIIDDPARSKKILHDAINMSNDTRGPLEKVWGDLQLMFGLVGDWLEGKYTEIPVGTIIAIFGGLIYFLSPIDIIPDFIPGLGLIDDVFVLGLVIKQISADLNKYKLWKETYMA